MGRPGRPGSGLRPTNPAALVGAALITAAVSWLVIRRYYGDLPRMNWIAGLTLAGLAIVEAIAARTTKARIQRRPGSGPVNPFLVARYAVLAKASSLGGSIFVGGYGAMATWALRERDQLRVAAHDVGPSLAGLVGALGLVAAALLLERACRVPPSDDEDEDSGDGARHPPP